MNSKISEIYDLLQELAWHFGNRGFDGQCCEDLSFVEFMALKKACDNNEASIQEIGAALNFSKSGATRIIDRLESKGYLVRQRSPVDGRICCVSLTNEGINTITRIMDRNATDLSQALIELEPGKIDQIQETLQILVRAIQRQD